jgi:hypothetical protein
MVASYGETSGYSAVSTRELELVNGGKGGGGGGGSSGTPTTWGNPVNDHVVAGLAATYCNINNTVGTAVINAAPVVANTVLGAALTATKGLVSVVTGLLTNTGGSSGSLN